MVVNRKQPAAPVPPVQSRSNSQQIMRKKPSKPINSNGITSYEPQHVPPTTPGPREKSTPQRQPRKKSLRDTLVFWFLSLFTLYSFLVCSPYTTTPQKSESHLVCRAETNYKTYILDPLILPPLKYSLSFTHSLAKPYISQANTHFEPYIEPIKPYVIQTAATTKRVWKGTLVPLYKYTLKPYYQSAIVPRYNLYLRPYLSPLVAHLERYYTYYISNPIRIQSNHAQLHFSVLYSAHIHPYLVHLQPYIHHFTSTIYTTWVSSIHVYGTHVQPTLLSTWIRAQPHLSFALNQAKDISLNAATETTKQLKGLAKQVGTQRRTYVDPHIRKIWDKVEANATVKAAMTASAPVDISVEEETAHSTIIEPPSSDSAVIEEITPITSTKVPETPPIPVPEEGGQDVLYPAESTLPPSVSSSQEETQSTISIAEASTHNASTAPHELEKEVEVLGVNTVDATTPATAENSEPGQKQKETEAEAKPKSEEPSKEPNVSVSVQERQEISSTESIAEATLGGATSPSPSVDTAAAGMIGVGAISPSATTADDDLEDFLRDIGFETSSSTPSPASQLSEANEAAASASASLSAQQTESSRLASIASKRLAITTRHSTLESDLQSSILSSSSLLIERLKEMRETKKHELVGLIEGIEGEGFILGLNQSAEKLMSGLEVYLKKCEARSSTWKLHGIVGYGVDGSGYEDKEKDEKEKRTLLAKDEETRFESVIEKVQIKFVDVVQKLQVQVQEWYISVIEREQEEVLKITTEIKDMAEQAQASLGLDYAWLEDVTYADWQRYHDLMRASEKFEQTANAIQNGTSVNPPSPSNPIKPALDDLGEELQHVISGFHVVLGSVKDMVPELFSIYGRIPDPEGGAGADAGEGDKFKIQPIEPEPDASDENGKKTRQNEGFDASKVIIGKSKEQVEQALEGVPLAVEHEEL